MKSDENGSAQSDTKSYDLNDIFGDLIFPDWTAICMKIVSEYKLHANIAQRLYHYTSLEGFQSIMQKRDFWISNIRYMNDSHEFENGKAICKEVIKAKLDIHDGDEIKQYLQGLWHVCDQGTSQGFFKIRSGDIFALSFCNNGDILTQWQFYGSEGISIGFENAVNTFDAITFMNEDQYEEEIKEMKPEELLPHDELRLFPHKVIYDDNKKREMFEVILDIGINFINRFSGFVDMCIEGISDVLFHYFALMKDVHLEHEHELRFLYYSNKDNKRIHFRKRNGILLPYTKMKILDVNCRPHNFFPVSDIIVAPGNRKEYVADSVKYFLEKSGYDYLIDKVRTSEVPYRN